MGKADIQELEAIYNFIVGYMKEKGYAPSIRKICKGTCYSSASWVRDCLTKLQLLGKIDIKPNTPRAIKLVGYKLVKEEADNGKGRPEVGITKQPIKRNVDKQDKKDLKTLADDFGLLHRADVQEIIETCRSYAEGQRKIMGVYTAVYM